MSIVTMKKAARSPSVHSQSQTSASYSGSESDAQSMSESMLSSLSSVSKSQSRGEMLHMSILTLAFCGSIVVCYLLYRKLKVLQKEVVDLKSSDSQLTEVDVAELSRQELQKLLQQPVPAPEADITPAFVPLQPVPQPVSQPVPQPVQLSVQLPRASKPIRVVAPPQPATIIELDDDVSDDEIEVEPVLQFAIEQSIENVQPAAEAAPKHLEHIEPNIMNTESVIEAKMPEVRAVEPVVESVIEPIVEPVIEVKVEPIMIETKTDKVVKKPKVVKKKNDVAVCI